MSISLSRDSNRKNYPIRLKFGTNVYILHRISCIVFGAHKASGFYEGNQQITNSSRSADVISFKNILTWLCSKENKKIHIYYVNAQKQKKTIRITLILCLKVLHKSI